MAQGRAEGEPLTEAEGLARGDADALRGADALAPTGVALLSAETLAAALLADAQEEGLPVIVLDGVEHGETLPGCALPLPENEGGGEPDAEGGPLADCEEEGEPVASAADPLAHGDPLADALPEAPSPEGEADADGVENKDALCAAVRVARLAEPAGVSEGGADALREKSAVALPEGDAEEEALGEGRGAEGVSGAVTDASDVVLGSEEIEARSLTEGGGERLPEGHPDGGAEAVGVPKELRDAVGEADAEGLGESLREAGGELVGRAEPLASEDSEEVWQALRVAMIGVREAKELPLPLPLALWQPEPLIEPPPDDALKISLREEEGVN